MVSQKVRVKNPSGLHLRPAGVLCSTALQFKCRVRFTFREATVNAKSVLSVLGACVKEGDEITFECEGEDEDQALATIAFCWLPPLMLRATVMGPWPLRTSNCLIRPSAYSRTASALMNP